jgi:hypothetical protein
MIEYKLDDLGWFEFEQLIQTVAKARLGFGIEAWGGRGDWGRDAYFLGKLRYKQDSQQIVGAQSDGGGVPGALEVLVSAVATASESADGSC